MMFILKRAKKHLPVFITLPLLFATFIALCIAITLSNTISYPYPDGVKVQNDWYTFYKQDDANQLKRFNLLEIIELISKAKSDYIAGIDWRMVLSSENKKESVGVEFLSEKSLYSLNLDMGSLSLPPQAVYVTSALAKRHGIDINDFVNLQTTSFVVKGILPESFNGLAGKAEVIANLSRFTSTEYYEVNHSVGRKIAEQSQLYFYFEQSAQTLTNNDKLKKLLGIQVNPLAYIKLYKVSYTLLFMAIFMLIVSLSCELLLTIKWMDNIQPKLSLQHVMGATLKNNLNYMLRIYIAPRLLLLITIYLATQQVIQTLTVYFPALTYLQLKSFWPLILITCIYIAFCSFITIKIRHNMSQKKQNITNLNRSTKRHKTSLLTSLVVLISTPSFLALLSIELFSAFNTLNRLPNLPFDDLYIVQFSNSQNTDVSKSRFDDMKTELDMIVYQLNLHHDYKVTSSSAAPFSPPSYEANLVAISNQVYSRPEKIKQIMITNKYQSVLQHQLTAGRMPVNITEVAVSESFMKRYMQGDAIGNSLFFNSKYTPSLEIVGVVKDGYWLDPNVSTIPLIWRVNKKYSNGYLILRTKEKNYRQRINQIITEERLTLKIKSAKSALDSKVELLVKEITLLITLAIVGLTILIATFFILATAIHNIVASKSVEVKVKMSLGATKKQVSVDILKSCYFDLIGGLFWGGAVCVVVIISIYPNISLLYVQVSLSLMIVFFTLLLSSVSQVRRIYNMSPADLFKDN